MRFSRPLLIDQYQETPGSSGVEFVTNPDISTDIPRFPWVRGFSPVIRLSTNDLYRRGGAYEYSRGVNPSAVISLAVGVTVALAGTVVPGMRWVYDYAWFVGFGLSGAMYIQLMRGRETG